MASAEVDVAAMYWGRIDSNVEWCEPNYVVPWAAEIVNSVTSLPITYFGLAGIACLHAVSQLKATGKYTVALLTVAAVGIGSFLFHLTLRRVAQSLDELPMIYAGMAFFFNSATMPSESQRSSTPPSFIASIPAFASFARLLSRAGISASVDSIFAVVLVFACMLMTAAYFLAGEFFMVFIAMYTLAVLSLAVVSFCQLFPRDVQAVRRWWSGAESKRKVSREKGEYINGNGYSYSNGIGHVNGSSKALSADGDGGLLNYSPHPLAAYLYKASLCLYGGGFSIWLFENSFCAYLPVWLYLHGMWHILAGLGSYAMVQCQLSYHCDMLHLKHQLKWHPILLMPYIEIQASGSRSGGGYQRSTTANGKEDKAVGLTVNGDHGLASII